jgi:hypothetical protein
VEKRLHRGQTDVVDADLADYFGSIPHAELMLSLARRIVDRRVLHLIKMWLECPVEETDDRGRKKRTTEDRDSRRGIPEGSPISPLLANAYMRLQLAHELAYSQQRPFGLASLAQEANSTSWVLRLGGCTQQRLVRPAWACGRRRRVSGAWSKRFMR